MYRVQIQELDLKLYHVDFMCKSDATSYIYERLEDHLEEFKIIPNFYGEVSLNSKINEWHCFANENLTGEKAIIKKIKLIKI